jgi:hypothetical protein
VYAIEERDITWLNHYIQEISAEKIKISIHCRDSANDPIELSSTETVSVSTIFNTSDTLLRTIPTSTGMLRITMSQEALTYGPAATEVGTRSQSHSVISELSWQGNVDMSYPGRSM